jgi:hypothetical protein
MTPDGAQTLSARRRRRRVVGLVAVILWAGYLTAGLTHRLEQGGSWWHDAEAATRVEEDRTQLVFTYNPGAPMTFGTTIRNPRPWPVTITGFWEDENRVFKHARVTMNRPGDAEFVSFDPATATAFEPIRLDPGNELPVFVTVTMPDVEFAAGSGIIFDTVMVHFNALGLPRDQQVPLGYRIRVRSPDGYVPR